MLTNNKKVLCTICARGNSKGVPKKNLANIGGLPLVAYSIRQAQKSGVFLYIAFSSDDESILTEAKKNGVDFLIKRPAEMATDSAPKIPAIQHCVKEVEKLTGEYFDIIVDLDVTSPLRTSNDIINAIDLLIKTDASNIISGCIARRSPYFNLVEEKEDGTVVLSKNIDRAVVRRQDAPKSYDMNASIYVWNRKTFFESESLFNEKTRLYQMPEERSIDIDTPLDLEIVRYLIEKK